jgi:hypothetical protein
LAPALSTDPTISQSVTGLSPGQLYAVSGDYKKTIDRTGGAITGLSFGVAIDGVFCFECSAPVDSSWQHFDFLFSVAAPSVLLSLSSQRNGTEVSYGIDNIAIWNIPEPSSAAQLVCGGFFVAVRLFRKRVRS